MEGYIQRDHPFKPAPSHFKPKHDQQLIKLALHKSPFFTCLDEEQIERLVAAAEIKRYSPGEIVILEGCLDRDDEDEEKVRSWGSLLREKRMMSRVISDGPGDDDEDMFDGLEPASDQAEEDPETDKEVVSASKTSTLQTSPLEEGGEADEDDEDENDSEHDETTALTTMELSDQPPPPRSNVKRSIYIVRSGHADVWYQPGFNPASLGPGTLFGAGSFLFGRQHSASVIANKHEPLECWVVDFPTFRDHVLPSDNMSRLFHKYASRKDMDGVVYMTMDDFVKAIEDEESGALQTTMQEPMVGLRIANTYNILSKTSKSGRIYLSDYCFYHLLMARPDPEVDIAFLLMDQRQTGQINIDDLAKFIEPVFSDLDLESQFFQRYFGKDRKLSIRQQEFSQFLVDLQREMGKQAFVRAVEERGVDGYLAPVDFVRVLKTSCGWRLPKGVADRLENIYCQGPIAAGEAAALVSLRAGSLKGASLQEVTRATEASVLADMETREKNLGMRYFSYGDFVAFQEVLAILPGICNLIDRAQEIKQGPVSPDDFKVANRVLGLGGRLSRRQVDIIFTLFDLDRDGYVSHEDTVSVCGVDFAQRLVAVKGRSGHLTFAPPPQFREEEPVNEDVLDDVGSHVQHFSLSALAGALGVVVFYPLEVVKTRLMNQRITVNGTGRLYAHSWDCIRQAFRAHGFVGLYRGLTPQLAGVAPEKAIKLQVNDLLRQVFSSNDIHTGQPNINLAFEMLAGACAGACQLLVTNPMELSKARLIIQDETSQLLQQRGLKPPATQSFTNLIRELGFPGVYRGASACLLRDVPFSAIYFPAYAACKHYLADLHDEASGMSHKASLSDLLLAGTMAAVPASLLTTPCDVIRIRLQTIPRPGDSVYRGIRDCASQMYRTEGWQAFFRGSTARVLRIAPQFGITLLAYEQITQWLGFHTAHRPPTNAPVDPRDYRTAFPASSLRPKTDDIDGWMRSFGLVQQQEPKISKQRKA